MDTDYVYCRFCRASMMANVVDHVDARPYESRDHFAAVMGIDASLRLVLP